MKKLRLSTQLYSLAGLAIGTALIGLAWSRVQARVVDRELAKAQLFDDQVLSLTTIQSRLSEMMFLLREGKITDPSSKLRFTKSAELLEIRTKILQDQTPTDSEHLYQIQKIERDARMIAADFKRIGEARDIDRAALIRDVEGLQSKLADEYADAAVDLDGEMKHLKGIVARLGLLLPLSFLGLGLLMGLLSVWIAQTLSSRFSVLLDAFYRFDLGSREAFVPVRVSRGDEIGEIERSYNQFGERLIATNQELQRRQMESVSQSRLASLGEMAGGVAHEINNPLAIIQGKASQLRRKSRSGALTPETLSLELTKIEETCSRISSIVRGLRSFSRTADKDPFSPADIGQIVTEALALCTEKLKSKGVELRIKILSTVSCECRAVQLGQVLVNLMNNSYDAILGTPSPWVEVQVEGSADFARIMVTDSGSGIPVEIADKIMQPFFTTKEVGKGTGLGLSISKGIIDDHHGKFELDKTHANTRFVIELPVHQPVGEGATPASSTETPKAA